MNFFKRKLFSAAAITILASIVFAGCGSDEQQQAQLPKQQVKVMKVVQRDTPLTSEYAGQLVGIEEVKVQSKVSGYIMRKYVRGGDFVEVNQPLFEIDSRQYKTTLLEAQASLAETVANLENAERDLLRYQQLLADEAIAEQTVANQAATVKAYKAAADTKAAAIQLARENLADTTIYAPMSGQLGVDDVAEGTFVTAGATTLVTIGSLNPIFAQFSISETEYLRFMTVQSAQTGNNPIQVSITLADGNEYPFAGRIVETDRALSNNTGSLTMKAAFPNPNGLLMPGMFARVRLSGETIPNAILVPQRAIQQILGKSFVMSVDQDGKSVAKPVELGQQIGSYYVVTKGVTAQDSVVVEGLTNLREGVDLDITNVTPGEMGFTLANIQTPYNTDTTADSKRANSN